MIYISIYDLYIFYLVKYIIQIFVMVISLLLFITCHLLLEMPDNSYGGLCLATRHRRLRVAKNLLRRPMKYLSTRQMLPDNGFSGDLGRIVTCRSNRSWRLTRRDDQSQEYSGVAELQRSCRAIFLRASAFLLNSTQSSARPEDRIPSITRHSLVISVKLR